MRWRDGTPTWNTYQLHFMWGVIPTPHYTPHTPNISQTPLPPTALAPLFSGAIFGKYPIHIIKFNIFSKT